MRQGTGSTGRDDAVHGGEAGAARCPCAGKGALPLHQGESRGEGLSWERLRSRFGGLAPVEITPGVPGWLLLGYKENLRVLRDQTHFSADPRPWSPSGVPPARSGALTRDGDEHQRLRLPIVDALASAGTPWLVPAVERAAAHLIGGVEAQGSADLIGEYAAPLPALVLNELFGLPDSYGHLLADLTARLWSGDPARAEPAALAVRAYFRGLVARKRAEPGKDVTTLILEHPHGLTDDEAVEALSLLWETGHEPTAHLIGNALLKLLEDPNVWTAYLGGTLAPEDFVDYVMWTDPRSACSPGATRPWTSGSRGPGSAGASRCSSGSPPRTPTPPWPAAPTTPWPWRGTAPTCRGVPAPTAARPPPSPGNWCAPPSTPPWTACAAWSWRSNPPNCAGVPR